MAPTPPTQTPRGGNQSIRRRRDRWWLLLLFLAISLLLHVGIGWEGRGWHLFDTGHPTPATPSPGEIEVAFDSPPATPHAAPYAKIPPKAPALAAPPRVPVRQVSTPPRRDTLPKTAPPHEARRRDRPAPIVRAAPATALPGTLPKHALTTVPVTAATPAAVLPPNISEPPVTTPIFRPEVNSEQPRVAEGPRQHLRAPLAHSPEEPVATPTPPPPPPIPPTPAPVRPTPSRPPIPPPASSRLGLTRGIPFGVQTGLDQPSGVISGYVNGVFHVRLGRPTAASLGLTPARIVYLLDISESMSEDNKIGLAREALRNAVKELLPDDSFLFITLSDHPTAYGTSLHPATAFNISTQESNVDVLQPNGGTNVSAALDLALGMTGVTHIFLISDGEPNEGITDYDELLTHLRKINPGGAVHISTFALGPGEEFQGVQLLKRIAEENGGEYRYINDKNSFEK